MEQFSNILTLEFGANLVRSIIIIIIGFTLAKFATKGLKNILKSHLNTQIIMIIEKGVFYTLFSLAFFSALNQLGINLRILLGAAGIFTVAVGFASQTSVSNLISGLFLLFERPFVVGDLIKVEDETGYVLSIDLLSTRLKTFDNLMVRLPNETLMKAKVKNFTHFPVRRIDLFIGVAYKENLEKVKEILIDLADKNPMCLEEPRPLFRFRQFGESSLDLQFSVWTVKENYLELKTQFYFSIKKAFDEHKIEIPFPHRTIYTGEITKPFPIEFNQENALNNT